MSIGTSPYLNNSFFISLLLSHLVERKYFCGNMGTYKIGELPWHNALGFFCWGEIPQNTKKNKKGVVYRFLNVKKLKCNLTSHLEVLLCSQD
jgi:hypothetical protein